MRGVKGTVASNETLPDDAPCPDRDRPPGGNAQPPCDHDPRAEPTSLGFVDWAKRLVLGLGGIATTFALDSDFINQLPSPF